jgi:cytochrome c peroxidase
MSKKNIGYTAVLICAVGLVFVFAGAMAAKPKPPDPELAPIEQLGKALFFDNISSPARHMSCATCHSSTTGWTGPNSGVNLHGAVYRGADPTRFGNRKPPSAAYASFSPVFYYDEEANEFFGGNFLDGRATGERLGSPTAEQAIGPYLNPVEHNMPSAQAVCEHVAASKYAGLFEQVWGVGSLDCSETGVDLTYDRIGLSIGAYEASSEVNQFSSKFDLYWAACLEADNSEEVCGLGEAEQEVLDPQGILSPQEFLGLIEFGEYCSDCHISHQSGPDGLPPLFSDFSYSNIGVPKNLKNPFYQMDTVYLDDGTPINPLGMDYIDYGLGAFLRTREAWADLAGENDGKFRTPTVRNVDMRLGKGFTKAFMHNGVFKSLEEVVSFYNTRDVAGMGWDLPEVDVNVNRDLFNNKPMGNFELSPEEEAAIVAFMQTLTDGYKP